MLFVLYMEEAPRSSTSTLFFIWLVKSKHWEYGSKQHDDEITILTVLNNLFLFSDSNLNIPKFRKKSKNYYFEEL